MADQERNILFPWIPPYIHFPENPEITNLEGQDVYKYISPNRVTTLIVEAALATLNLDSFDNLLVNQHGGEYVGRLIRNLFGSTRPLTNIKYHRSQDGHSAIRTVPIPYEMSKQKNLIFEDVLDSGISIRTMLKDSPSSTFFVVAHKMNVPNQILPPEGSLIAALKTDNHWLGGSGMNFGGSDYPEDYPRNYPGIVVKI